MYSHSEVPPPSRSAIPRGQTIKGLVGTAAFFVCIAVTLLISAGTWYWIEAWCLLAALAACMALDFVVLIRSNPDVIETRLQKERGAKRWDLFLSPAMVITWFVGLIVAGLDHRFGWSPPIMLGIKGVAMVLFVAGNLIVLWAMVVNKFFAKLVRIQTEKGHATISVGPYRYVRHPGYAGWFLSSVAGPLVLGSFWAEVPIACALVVTVVRTVLEDRTLRQELPGYQDYSRRVRYRLVPWLWIS
ncbi:MAG: isoprenylcysteine carboxylmethyltransferase family protein [Thermodesulfobacteriota bacterium]